MSSSTSARRAGRRTRSLALAATVLVLLAAGLLVLLERESPAVSSWTATTVPRLTGHRADDLLHDGATGGSLTAADGKVPDGVTVFDDHYPAVTRLQPALLAALRAAATRAARDGVTFDVNSGWRSRAYQQVLFDQAVATYGSAAEAARWVARPGTSVHEAGEAADIGPTAAAAWLSAHGAGYGLCQIYRNESWHYELRPAAVQHGCPPMYADPTHDPRLQQ